VLERDALGTVFRQERWIGARQVEDVMLIHHGRVSGGAERHGRGRDDDSLDVAPLRGVEHLSSAEHGGLEHAPRVTLPGRVSGGEVVQAIAAGERSIDSVPAEDVTHAELDLVLRKPAQRAQIGPRSNEGLDPFAARDQVPNQS
jgi:hypothetical protein